MTHQYTCNGSHYTCPICGRSVILVSLKPLRVIVLVVGNLLVNHSGFTLTQNAH